MPKSCGMKSISRSRSEFRITASPLTGSPHTVEFSPTNSQQTYACEFRAINSMDEIWGILHQLPAAWPQYFTIRGNNSGFFLMLYPSPGAAGQLTVYYYCQAVVISTDSDFIDTLSGWEDTVYDYAVFKALRAAKDATWQQAFTIYESKLAQMKDTTRNFTDLGNVVTSGIANWPTYTYADNGGY